jgi:hypothetical protein
VIPLRLSWSATRALVASILPQAPAADVDRVGEEGDLDALARLGVVVLDSKRVRAPRVPWEWVEIRVGV